MHFFGNFVPGLLRFCDTPDIAALIAPRALHLNFGELDGGSPIDFVQKALPRIEQAYTDTRALEKFTSLY